MMNWPYRLMMADGETFFCDLLEHAVRWHCYFLARGFHVGPIEVNCSDGWQLAHTDRCEAMCVRGPFCKEDTVSYNYRFETPNCASLYMYFETFSVACKVRLIVAQEREVGSMEVSCPICGWTPVALGGGCKQCREGGNDVGS